LPDIVIEPIVRASLAEDLGLSGDVTGALAGAAPISCLVRARQAGVLAGLAPAGLTCRLLDPALRFEPLLAEGGSITAGEAVARLSGPAASVLAAERTVLNFLTHLSGVATLTHAFVQRVAHTRARIAATRKTLPGLRALQKAAVVAAGGLPHRYSLADAVLIKDNHIAAAGSVAEALRRAQALAGHMRVLEVEVDRLDQLEQALPFRPHAVLLDNFQLADLRKAVALAGGAVVLEASGGVTLETAAAIAETGVDVISVGALTHSAPALDLGLDAA
jgi:nicotinate-nucleotide pyrophosphorylase (carboxylating)